ncbi:MAG: cysteine--tRNA ligase [Candidatus Heimdallarchaeota archaeon]|nr:MAG: cysteine--tRNA ligase [Candidatus Heimdallarchaeota archaeon]
MKLFNSLTRQKEEFIPIENKKVRFYSCGQTIYLDVHLGNVRTYSYWDVLVRYLRWRGFDVFWVQNITDVGHLTDDADSGEDRIVKTARDKNLEPMVLVETQIKRFFEDIDALNIQRADVYPRATGHIPEMIDFISELLKKGYAYVVNGSVYFDVHKFPSYGELSPSSYSEESAGVRVAVNPEKRNPRDFALWIKAPPNYLMKWPSPWGLGYPGWHLECSVMSQKYLGDTLDIHSGGIEHLMLHHPNEIAQSEARTGKKFVNYWIHANHLIVNGRKMSKSLGNYILIRDLLKKYDPTAIRFFLINSHYRKNLDFNEDAFKEAQNLLTRIKNTLTLIGQIPGGEETTLTADLEILETEFIQAMDDDLNTVAAIQSIMKFIRKLNFALENQRKTVLDVSKGKIIELLEILGITLETANMEQNKGELVESLVDLLINVREDLRKAKMFGISDKIRSNLSKLGIILEDKGTGTIWKKQ